MTFVKKHPWILFSLCLFLAISGYTIWYLKQPYYPTVHQYILSEPGALYVDPTHYKIDHYKPHCEGRPTVLDENFESWGGAYPGFIIMNPRAIKALSTTVKLYIYEHECGHQYTGVNESRADNFAIARGLKSGWLHNFAEMKKICHFVSKIPADDLHKDGKIRCKEMTAFFKKNLTKARKKPVKQTF